MNSNWLLAISVIICNCKCNIPSMMALKSSNLLMGDNLLGIPSINDNAMFLLHDSEQTNGSLKTDIEARATVVFSKRFY